MRMSGRGEYFLGHAHLNVLNRRHAHLACLIRIEHGFVHTLVPLHLCYHALLQKM